MTLFDPVISLRRSGVKPRAVFVDMVAAKFREQPLLTDGGVVTVQLVPSQSLADLDCRPLVGLTVHVQDFTDDRERHRALAVLVAQAKPALVVMPCMNADGSVTLHKRIGGAEPRNETTRL